MYINWNTQEIQHFSFFPLLPPIPGLSEVLHPSASAESLPTVIQYDIKLLNDLYISSTTTWTLTGTISPI
jgi:hypothetical protein